ncbi:hypothetical protein ACOSP7_020738 [Xanthoceras sorbifolium]
MARDSYGSLILAAAKCSQGSVGVEVVEAIAILEGLQVILRENLSPILLNLDALTVINLCKGVSFSRLEVDNIVYDIHNLLRSHNSVSLSLSPRCCNSAVHGVAR